MGTNISTGFQELPEVYLRDLRRKTRRRYKSVLIDRQSKAYLEKKAAPDEGGAAVLNADTVAEYVISNPDFLDNLVEKHIAQDRVRAWIKESMEDEGRVLESVDYEGNLEISAQEEAIEEEEKIHGSKEDEEEFHIKSISTSGRMLDKISDGVISKKFSKKDLQQLTMKISEEQKKEEELKKIKQEEDLRGKRGKKAQRKAQEKKEEDEKKKEEKKKKKKSKEDQKEGKEDEEKEEKEGVEKDGGEKPEMESAARKSTVVNLPVESKMFAKSQQKVTKRSRGDSNFSQQITDLSFRQRKVLIITRHHLLFPQSLKHQELKELLERPEVLGLPELESHMFPYTEVPYENINKVFILMSKNLFGKFGFPMTELCYFLTALKANYNDVEYHNYSHALSHAQSMYWILKKTPGVFTELEMKALMISSLAHDVAHPGLNESYLKKVHCTLSLMYDDPLIEQHQVQTCYLILQDIRCNIFCDLGTNDYKQVLDEIKHTILATNLQKYQLQCERMRHIVETGVDFRKKHVRNCLKALMMMACDLCAGWKRWDEHKNVIWSLYKEYFNQGDKELSFGIITPDHMLRTNAENIPKYQTAFMENVVLPIYQLLTKVFPQLREILKTAQENLDCWKTY